MTTRGPFCPCPVRNQARLTAKAAGAAGWDLPPELGEKRPLPQRHRTGEGLSSPIRHRHPPLALSRDLGFSLGFSICSCPCLPAPCLPRTPRSITELLGRSSQSWSGPCRMEEGWGGCGEPGPSLLPKGFFFGQGLAVPKSPREGKSRPSSPQTQRHMEKKRETKWARGRNTGQRRSGKGLQTV